MILYKSLLAYFNKFLKEDDYQNNAYSINTFFLSAYRINTFFKSAYLISTYEKTAY